MPNLRPSAPLGSSEEDDDKKHRDPVLSNFVLPKKMNEQKQKARKKSNQAGVLFGEKSEPGKVYKISVQSTTRVDADAILPQIDLKLGEYLSEAQIAKDIKNIYGMGLFKNIVVEKILSKNDSWHVVYKLEGKKIIYNVKIKNNDAIGEDDILEVLTFERNHVADIPRIIEEIEKVRQLYVAKGYFLADVDFELIPLKKSEFEEGKKDPKFAFDDSKEDGENDSVKFYDTKIYSPDLVDLEISISENSKVKIENINFLGNKYLSSDKIIGHMRSRENHPLGIMTKWGTFNEEMFDVDLLLIENFYQENGFLEVKVGKPRVALSADKNRLTIFIPIEEGKQYKIKDIKISMPDLNQKLAKIITEEKLNEYVSLAPGDIFNRTEIAKSLMAITEIYKDEGYAYANVNPMTQVDEKKQVVSIDIKIDPGSQVYIGKIEIAGNDKTMDEVIRREVRVHEGELYSSSMLRLSEQRVKQLGYFETVKFSQGKSKHKDRMKIIVQVKEKQTGTIQGGAGFGTGGEGLVLQGQVSQNNLFGRGQSLTAQIQWSSFRRIFDVRFVDPYAITFGENAIAFAFSAYNTSRFMGSFSRESSGGDFTFGYSIGKFLTEYSNRWAKQVSREWQEYVPDFENLKLFLTFNAERVSITDSDIGVRLFDLHLEQPRYTTALKLTLQFDQRNNRLTPSKGYYFDLSAEFATRYLGSELMAMAENAVINDRDRSDLASGAWYLDKPAATNNYFRINNNYRFYYSKGGESFIEQIIIKGNLNIGYLNAYEGDLIFENYMLGGIGTIRGYYYRSLGPVKRVSGLSGSQSALMPFIVGGNKQIFGNIELEFPILKALGLGGVLFFDFGNSFSPRENIFYVGGAASETPSFSAGLPLGLYYAIGFGVRWQSPFGMMRFEFGIPLTPRPKGTLGREQGDSPIQFEFNVGPSF